MSISFKVKSFFSFAFILMIGASVPLTAQNTKNVNAKAPAKVSNIVVEEAYAAENEGWLVLLDEAFKESKKTGKPILANFTGSDWCGWCKKLTRDVFVKKDFKEWADENVVLLELDFPRRKTLPQNIQEQNRGLQQAFKISGYPSIWVFDLDKDEEGRYSISAHGKTGYNKTPEEFTTGVDRMLQKRKTN